VLVERGRPIGYVKSQIGFQFENAEKKLFAMAGLNVTGPYATVYIPLLTPVRSLWTIHISGGTVGVK
jgi:hypothetical protein